jgi:hypothetical protein
LIHICPFSDISERLISPIKVHGGALEMRYSSQTVFGLLAILSIALVQTMDMGHGTRNLYANAVNDISTDDGLIFETRATTAAGVNAITQVRNALRAI